jgi:hypothetical protein
MTNQTYSVTFTSQDFDLALETIREKSTLFLNPYHGDARATVFEVLEEVDWEPSIARIMDQFDEAWRDLAHL